MRAIIMATGDSPGTDPLNERHPTPLLPLVDRPFLQHVIEFCVHQGITRFDLVLSHLPEKIEHFLGDGKRWGCTFTVHLARDPVRPYRLLKVLDLEGGPDEPLLLGHADRLPQFRLPEVDALAPLPVLFCWHDEGAAEPARQRRWAGWALLSPGVIAALPADPDEHELEDHLRALAAHERSWCEVPRPLSVATFDEFLAAHRAVLGKAFLGLLLSGREADPGVWLSRNVKLHPTVQLIPPVYIGENCSIDAGVRLGPNAVIGKDCMLDAHCTASNSVVFPGSYIGQALELADVIVDRNRLINVRLGGAVPVTDDFLIASLSDSPFREGIARIFGRLVALLVLLVASPVLLLTALCLALFRRGPVLHRREVVRLPAPAADPRWRGFRLLSFSPDGAARQTPGAGIPCGFRALLLRVLPALVHVLRGDLAFVGLPPRTREEIGLLPHDWQALYLRGKAGLVTEAAVCSGPDPDEDELYAAEAFYTATANWGHDLALLFRFLARSLRRR